MPNLHKFLIWLLLITGLLVSALPRQTEETRSNDLHGQEQDDVAEISAQYRAPDRDLGKGMDKDHDHDHDKHTCGGGCSRGAKETARGHWRRPTPTPTPRAAEDSDYDGDDLAFQPAFRPRPIYGLLGDIIETARHGLRVDRPRAHILF